MPAKSGLREAGVRVNRSESWVFTGGARTARTARTALSSPAPSCAGSMATACISETARAVPMGRVDEISVSCGIDTFAAGGGCGRREERGEQLARDILYNNKY